MSLSTIQRGADGLWRGAGYDLGAVLLARQGDRILLVRKARRAGYAYSGMWTMPGGRIRGDGPLAEAIDRTVRQRVEAEAGVSISGGILPLPGQPPLSRYAVGGEQRSTLVLPLTAQVDGTPRALDASISDASWCELSGMWRQIAPANRVILGAALWPALDGLQRSAARSALQSAWEDCAMWAAMLRLPPPPEPWRLA